jgi:TldD protein
MKTTWLLHRFDRDLIGRVLADALSRGGDYADVFFEERAESSLQMEDGTIRSASNGSVAGIGVRVLAGERTGYAFTEDCTPEALHRVARTAAAIADEVRDVAPVAVNDRTVRDLYRPSVPLVGASLSERVKLMERADAAARAVDERIRKVNVSLNEEMKTVAVASSDGVLVEDAQPMISFRVMCIAEDGELRTTGTSGDGARRGLELMDGDAPERIGRLAAEQAVRNLSAKPAPGGPQTVVLGNAYSGVLLHEAVGHGLEADFNHKGFSRYSGQIGERVASPLVTVVDDGTIANERGSINVDDEGNVSGSSVLIEDGILRGYLHDRLSARVMNVAPTGNGRRESYSCMPMPRMTNTFMLAGEHSPEEIIGSVERGIYAVHFGGGQVEIGKGDFVFAATEAYLIEDGKITSPLRDVTLIGNGPEVMQKVTMAGNDYRISEGMWTCGKDGQSVPVGVGMPTVKISSITVGGTA